MTESSPPGTLVHDVERRSELEKSRSEDIQLAARVQQGDRAPFTLLVEKHGERVGRFLSRLVHKNDVDDVFQETWFRVSRTIRGYDPGRGPFFTWLLWQAHSCASSWLRSQRKAERLTDELAAKGPSLLAELERSDDVERVQQLVERLPKKYGQVIDLLDLKEWSVKATAKELKIPEGTVFSRHSTGLRRLRELYQVHEQG
jgi:RNA polymerase sigma-70 factor (ECF subfamily)